MGVPIPEYCDECEKLTLVEGVDTCTVYPSPCKKVGLSGGGLGVIGCAFSPMEGQEVDRKRVRVGQQKSKRRK